MKKNEFAKGYCFHKYFWIFIIGSVFGVYWEQIYTLVLHLLNEGIWVWKLKRGVIYGPFNPLYGAGAVILTMAFAKNKNYKWYHYLLYGAVLGGTVEYLTSYFQELVVGSVSWNYHNKFLNINGRTTIPFAFVWGALALVLVKIFYPSISALVESLPQKFGRILTNILIVLVAIDFTVSWGSLFRQILRHNNIPAYTFVGDFFDKYYSDEKLKESYTNMVIIEAKK